MTKLAITRLGHLSVWMLGRSGVYSSSPGTGQAPEGFGAILLFAVLGGFFGLLAGLMFSHILRYVAFLMGRSPGGYVWAAYGALVGAIIFAWLAATSDE